MTDPVEPVPLIDLGLQHREIAAEVAAGWERVLARSAFILGDEVPSFESAYARFIGVRHCIGVANGTDAIELALRAAGVGPGDEVVLPANTFVATALAVMRAGARPVLSDIDDTYMLIEPDDAMRAATPKTRAMIPVHLYGQAAPVEALREAIGDRPIVIVEDAAQSQGAMRNGRPAGGLGLVAGTSFYPSKNIGAYGDAGAVTTDDDEVARRVRALRDYGSVAKYRHAEVGFNSRLDTLQAVVLSAKLSRLRAWNGARQEAAVRYEKMLAGVDEIRVPEVAPGNEHVWYVYPVRIARRDDVLASLHAAGIGAGVHYPVPVHLQEAFASLGHARGDFPVTEAACDEVLSLPMFPGITEAQQERVCAVLRGAIR